MNRTKIQKISSFRVTRFMEEEENLLFESKDKISWLIDTTTITTLSKSSDNKSKNVFWCLIRVYFVTSSVET